MNQKKARGKRKEAGFHPDDKRKQRRKKFGEKETVFNIGSRRRYQQLKKEK